MSMFEGLFEIYVHIFFCDGCATYRIVDIQVAHVCVVRQIET